MRNRAAALLACISVAMLSAQAPAAEEPPVVAALVHCTVLPGERVSDLARRLQSEGLSSPELFLRIASTAEFPAFPFVPGPQRSLSRFEGLFVPGRYALSLEGASPYSLSERQKLALTREMISELLGASARRFRTFHSRIGLSLAQSIILASIVEKESVTGRDYGKIASVFVNRLRSRMALASCPSVEYFLGYHRPYLLRSDVEIDSPYNLYLHRGLPPTPIAFFSDAAFRSVMEPPETPYKFFVFDWARGKHYFAADYAHHMVNLEISTRDFIAAYGAAQMSRKSPAKYYQY
jgi:UPF0755 protein